MSSFDQAAGDVRFASRRPYTRASAEVHLQGVTLMESSEADSVAGWVKTQAVHGAWQCADGMLTPDLLQLVVHECPTCTAPAAMQT